MRDKFDNLFGVFREAVLLLRGDAVFYRNRAAEALFPGRAGEEALLKLLPKECLQPGVPAVCSIGADGRSYTVSAADWDDLRMLSVTAADPEQQAEQDRVFAELSRQLREPLARVQMAAGLLRQRLPQLAEPGLEQYTGILLRDF